MKAPSTKGHKVLHAFSCKTIYDVVDLAAELDIQREDIVTLTRENDSYVLLYYYGKDLDK